MTNLNQILIEAVKVFNEENQNTDHPLHSNLVGKGFHFVKNEKAHFPGVGLGMPTTIHHYEKGSDKAKLGYSLRGKPYAKINGERFTESEKPVLKTFDVKNDPYNKSRFAHLADKPKKNIKESETQDPSHKKTGYHKILTDHGFTYQNTSQGAHGKTHNYTHPDQTAHTFHHDGG